MGAEYNAAFGLCYPTNIHRSLAGGIAIPAADAILLLLMLVGLLLRAHGNKVGIWRVLYNQCIIWMVVAAVAEIPPLVFLILNLNVAWNTMFPEVAVAIMSICAARMYRSLCKQGSLTEYEHAPSDPPYPARGLPFPNCYRRSAHDSLHFSTGAGMMSQSERITTEPFVFVEAEQVQADYDYVPTTASISTVTVPAKTKSRYEPVHAGYQLSWNRPVDPSLRFYE